MATSAALEQGLAEMPARIAAAVADSLDRRAREYRRAPHLAAELIPALADVFPEEVPAVVTEALRAEARAARRGPVSITRQLDLVALSMAVNGRAA